MKRLIVLAMLIVMFGVGCELANLGDPNSPESHSARDVLAGAKSAAPLVPSPIKEGLLGTVAAIGAILTAIQTKRKKTVEVAKARAEVTTAQIVSGIDKAVKDGLITASQSFSDVMNDSQDSITKDTVNKIQGKAYGTCTQAFGSK